MRKFRAIISIILAALTVLICTASYITVNAADAVTVSYTFSGSQSEGAGYAQGTITVKPASSSSYGSYTIYWGSGDNRLSGYRPIAALDVDSSSGASFTMPEFTCIPNGATSVIAVLSSDTDTVAGRYDIPQGKQSPYSDSDMLYSFEQISDIHMDHTGYYRYDKLHLTNALDTAVKLNADFIITVGDMITNNDFGHDADWRRYTDTLAASDYVNPIYEGLGNHEVWESISSGTSEFITATGLSDDDEALNAKNAYYEMTEPKTGDHFLFMAIQGSFYGNESDQFTTAQLNWLKSKLESYKDDGKNVFIIEHVLFNGWGSGDVMSNLIYTGPLSFSYPSTVELQNILKTYKNVFFTTGHTHIALQEHCNITNENGTSAFQIHNPSLGCPKNIDYKNRKLVSNFKESNTEGYIVEVYSDHVLYKGTNMYFSEAVPECCYIVPGKSSLLPIGSEVTEPSTAATSATVATAATSETVTVTTTVSEVTSALAESTAPSQSVEVSDTTESTAVTDNTQTTAPTKPATHNLGDVDLDGHISVKDATTIQKYLSDLLMLDSEQVAVADVNGDGKVNIKDATTIQKYIADIITAFPGDKMTPVAVSADMTELDKLIADAQDSLKKNSRLASYNSYQAVKKLVYEYRDSSSVTSENIEKKYSLLEQALNKLNDTASKVPGGTTGETITVKFSNNKNWSGTIYAYVWGSGGKLASWPGTKMESVGTNSYGEAVYSFSVDTSQYQNIIFTNSQKQTVDIALSNSTNYYLTGSTDSKGNYIVANS